MLAMRAEVPAQDIVVEALRSAPIVGRATPIEFWSIKAMRRAKARPEKTIRSLAIGSMFVSTRIRDGDGDIVIAACH